MSGGWRRAGGIAYVAGLAAAMAVASVPAPPRLASPVVLVSADSRCGVPTLTASAELAATAGVAATTVAAYPRPARPALIDLAQRIAPADCDTTNGRFHVVRHRDWWYSRAAGRQRVQEAVRWYAEDDSGAALTIEHPNPYPGVVRDYWLPWHLVDKHLSNAFVNSDWLRSRAALQTTQIDDPPDAFLIGLAKLATWYHPRPSGRALAVHLLADLPGLIAYPRTVDRAGRIGLGIAAVTENGRERSLLILHPATGEVFAYEYATRTAAGWRVHRYLLVLTRTHAERRWREPPTRTGRPATTAQPPGLMMPRPPHLWLEIPAEPCITAPTSEEASATSDHLSWSPRP
ncbi:hypothetical protein ABT235_20835 [Micromonospora echinofusca]|uniref:hypothetical protein n=1 Tax=Micromonospora echinofusca TaxID=47858 RepID=UPI001183D08B